MFELASERWNLRRLGMTPQSREASTPPCTNERLSEDPVSVATMTTHQITLGAINLEAQNPATLADFWASVTGALPSPGGDSVYLPFAGPGGFAMFFQPMTGPRPEHQTFHLDLTVPWGHDRPRSDASSTSVPLTSGTSLTNSHTCGGPLLLTGRGTSSAWPNTHPQTNRVCDPTQVKHRVCERLRQRGATKTPKDSDRLRALELPQLDQFGLSTAEDGCAVRTPWLGFRRSPSSQRGASFSFPCRARNIRHNRQETVRAASARSQHNPVRQRQIRKSCHEQS